jgi:hypothetical protein
VAVSTGDNDGGYGSRRYKFLEKIDYEAMRNFVVSIDRVSQPAPSEAPGTRRGDTTRRTI